MAINKNNPNNHNELVTLAETKAPMVLKSKQHLFFELTIVVVIFGGQSQYKSTCRCCRVDIHPAEVEGANIIKSYGRNSTCTSKKSEAITKVQHISLISVRFDTTYTCISKVSTRHLRDGKIPRVNAHAYASGTRCSPLS